MYLRKSRSDGDAPVDETLARHHAALTEFAQRNAIQVLRVYKEVASGDSLAARPEMRQLLCDLKAYGSVLCMDIDRLGRGRMRDQGEIFDAFLDANVLVVTPAKTYDLSSDIDDTMIGFRALLAREEYKLIRARLRRGFMRTVQEGGYVAVAPFGYTKVRIDKKPSLAINEAEAVGVRMIFDLYTGGSGCQIIADTLHSLGYRPHRGEKFNRTSIAHILRNPAYIGKVVWNRSTHNRPRTPGGKHTIRKSDPADWVTCDGLHPAIITEEQFAMANKIYDSRYHPPSRRPDELKNPLAGVLYCGNCGRAMTRLPMYNKPLAQPSIICQTKNCCMGSSQTAVEDEFYTLLELTLAGLEADSPEMPATLPNHDSIVSAARSEITKLSSQLGSLHDLLEQGVYTVETFLARREDIEKRIAEAQRIADNSRPVERAALIERLKTVLDGYAAGTPTERNRLIKEVISRVEYFKPKGSGWNTRPVLRLKQWAKYL
jgi:DNA invertase Pin-like site-specific DNA recombinase